MKALRLLAIAAVIAAPCVARAQPANIPSGFQIVLDGSVRMINKDVQQSDGTLERWAIMYDPARVGVASTTPGVFIGNVFRATGGEPAFVYCSALPPPDSQNVAFQCWGADKCQTSSCPSGTDWTVIASADRPFVVPRSFFEPRPVTVPQPTSTPQPSDDLSALIGTWNFTFTIISTFTETYRLQQRVTTSTGIPGIVGLDQVGNGVAAFRVQDASPGAQTPFEFTLVDTSTCLIHLFDRSGETVSGETFVLLPDSAGACDPNNAHGPFAMSGLRISTSAATIGTEGFSVDLHAVEAARAHALGTEVEALGVPNAADLEVVRAVSRAVIRAAQ